VKRTHIVLIAIGVIVALTRLLAAAHSLWEWDEALFCLGVRDYNVAMHNPHPPGFPLYILLGKLFRFFTGDEFRALRAVNVLSAMLVFPATYMLARELALEVMTSISAALLTCFAPNVWFYGGTAFSDEPTLVMLLFGAALLLRGRTSRGAYFAGCIVMAAACVMRPQNVLLGAYPFLAGSWPRWKERKLDPILGTLIMLVIIAAFFGGAAYVTGFDAYRQALRDHSQYVLSVDSFHNPGRAPWFRTYRQFLLDPYGAGRISTVIAIFAAIGLLRARRPALESLAIFGPFVIFCLFMLNPESGGRYAVTSMPMLMICCAEGIAVGCAVARLRGRVAIAIQALFMMAIAGKLIVWTLPALAEVRNHDAPTYAAMMWVRQHIDPKQSTIYVSELDPIADYLLPDYRRSTIDSALPGVSLSDHNAWLVAEHASAARGAVNFARPHGHLFDISRKRYFEVAVRPMVPNVAFLDGWYGEESGGGEIWRWMGQHSSMRLEPLAGKGELALIFDVPLDAEPRKPVATIAVNGQVLERVVCDARMEKRWVVPSNPRAPNVLTIDVDEVAKGIDPRDLGLRLRAISWHSEGK